MSPSSVAPSAPITGFATELDVLVADAMSEWQIPGLAPIDRGIAQVRCSP
jgi:hypothetical protein